MAEGTHISWANDTFNPWKGCTKVSVGPQGACENCYAENWANRYGQVEWGGPPAKTAPSTWAKPRTWNREQGEVLRAWRAGGCVGPMPTRFVFCASLADVFDNKADPEWRRELFDLIRETPNLTWLLLTKRPQNIVKLFVECQSLPSEMDLSLAWPRNAAIGCTVVTQKEADRDIPWLLRAAALLKPAFTFLSMEPLMEAVDLMEISTMKFRGAEVLNALTGVLQGMFGDFCATKLPRIDWVITGKESDQTVGARITPDGACEAVRDQCAAAGVPYHHKQNGEWIKVTDRQALPGRVAVEEVDGVLYAKVGLKNTGRELDGVIHDARPVPKHLVAA